MEDFKELTEEKESNFDLKAEIFKYLAYWKWMLLGFLIGGTVAFLYNRYSIPEYRTEASLMVLNDNDNNIAGALPSGGGSILSLEDNTLDNQIVTLKSKRLVKKVVSELKHNVSYYIEGSVITTEAYDLSPVFIKFDSPDSLVHELSLSITLSIDSNNGFTILNESKDSNSNYKFGQTISKNGVDFHIIANPKIFKSETSENRVVRIIVQPLEDVASNYIQKLVIGPKGKADEILLLSLVQEESKRSEDFLNNLMYQFNLDGVADKSQVALNTTEFIQNRLELITSELDSVEGGIADFKRDNSFMDVNSGAAQFISKSTEAEKQIFELETEKLVILSVQELINKDGGYNLLPTNLGISDAGISSVITSYNELILERNALLRTSTPQNPVVAGISAELDALKENLKSNIVNALSTLNLQLKGLNQKDAIAQNRFSSFPGMEKGMRGIVRQQQIKEELYLFLLQRREEAAIAFAVTSPVAKVIDSAYTFPSPVDPKPWLILIGGFLIGLLIPLGILFTTFMLDTKIHHKGDLTTLIKNIPFIGEVPRITESKNETIQLNDRSPLAESFRILRTNLAYLLKARNDNRGEIIYVTSTIKGEGKTFISYNLARTLASTKKKVVIIGADIRNPKLHRYLDLPMETRGLSDYLYDYDINPADIVSPSSDQDIKVDLILSGAIPPNPAELFMSNRMKDLLEYLSSKYDFVIVDTAPTMIVTDTLLISPLADTTIYVTRAGYTEKKLLDFPKDLKQQGKLKGLAIVLNDVDYSKFSYGAKYGYSYGYGYGYGADEESRWKKVFKKGSKKA